MNSCEERKCRFWIVDHCNDPQEWIDPEDGELSCRFRAGVIMKPAPEKVKSPQAKMMIRALFIDLLDRVTQHETGVSELIPEAYEDYSNDILVLCKLIDS